MLNLIQEHWPFFAAVLAGVYAAVPRLKAWFAAQHLPALSGKATSDPSGLDVTTDHVKELIRGAKSQEQVNDILAYYSKHVAIKQGSAE